ncbi:hypothetical protein BDC45DRAFT_529760 [Circinella umbellata]|nr:hypothetical protein BDC45DRAFT_529760 [Circinella umbellata]
MWLRVIQGTKKTITFCLLSRLLLLNAFETRYWCNQTVNSLKIIPLKRSLETTSTDNNDEIQSTQTLEEICNINILPRIQNALNQGQNDKVIEESRQMLADLESIRINVIKLQMNAWKNKGNLSKQLKYAKIIIEHAPKDSIGYINAAEVYSMRGQQVRVRTVTNRGMVHVQKNDKDGHAKLRKLDQDGLCQISKRIDFIAELPYDLACMVAKCSQFESLHEYIMVSRTWRERLLQCPTLWRRWKYYTYCDSKNRVRFLPKITAHIQELSVSTIGESQSPFENIIKLLESVEFPALRKLTVKAVMGGIYNHNSGFLKKVSATVTHLSLLLDNVKVIPLSQVLMDCRNLTKLEYGSFGTDPTHFIVPSLEYTTSLKMLHIMTNGLFAIAGDSLDGIIKNSPKLRVLSLNEVDASILPTIYQYCPGLVSLALNSESFMDVKDSVVGRISDGVTDLQYLHLYRVSSFKYVKLFLEKHQNTLKELKLGINISQGSQEDEAQNWRFLSFLKMPKLKYVLYDMHSSSSLEQYVAPMIQHSPLIHTMRLKNFFNHGITDDMIQVMGALRLYKIVIHSCKFVLTNKEAAIKVFQKLYDLLDVEIQYCFGTAQIALETVASLPSLIYLEIVGQNEMTMDDLQNFIVKLVRTSNCLRRVAFEDMTLNNKVLEKFQNGFFGKEISLRGN